MSHAQRQPLAIGEEVDRDLTFQDHEVVVEGQVVVPAARGRRLADAVHAEVVLTVVVAGQPLGFPFALTSLKQSERRVARSSL
jgi:hypothetical protein